MLQTHKLLRTTLGDARVEHLFNTTNAFLRHIYSFLVKCFVAPVAAVLGASPNPHMHTDVESVSTDDGHARSLTAGVPLWRNLQSFLLWMGWGPAMDMPEAKTGGAQESVFQLEFDLSADTVVIIVLCALFGVLMMVRLRRGNDAVIR
jgi:hypothetical protein